MFRSEFGGGLSYGIFFDSNVVVSYDRLLLLRYGGNEFFDY